MSEYNTQQLCKAVLQLQAEISTLSERVSNVIERDEQAREDHEGRIRRLEEEQTRLLVKFTLAAAAITSVIVPVGVAAGLKLIGAY